MPWLYSNMPPLRLEDGQNSIVRWMEEQFQKADAIEIAVGYISQASLDRLDELVCGKHIVLTIGMYAIEGISHFSWKKILELNEKWQQAGIGEIRLVQPFKYHGKAYVFLKNGVPFAGAVGSENLSVLRPDSDTYRQYELSSYTYDSEDCENLLKHIRSVEKPPVSLNVSEKNIRIKFVEEKNEALNSSIAGINELIAETTAVYLTHKIPKLVFKLPLKVPSYDRRFSEEKKDYTKSNINVSYAAPRSAKKRRDWYESQLTVSKAITSLPGYPVTDDYFWVVTDDGFAFAAHTTSEHHKQFAAVGDETIMGRWIKGRLVEAGIVTPINDVSKDINRTHMITKEMLEQYGTNYIEFAKTTDKVRNTVNSDGPDLDVWTLSFPPNKGLI